MQDLLSEGICNDIIVGIHTGGLKALYICGIFS